MDGTVYYDEHVTSGRAATAATIIEITWFCMANHVEEKMVKRATWQPRKFTSMEEMSNPFQLQQQRQQDNMEEGLERLF